MQASKNKAELLMTELVHATNILVVASHTRDLILHICNRVLWLEQGKILMAGAPLSVVET